MKLKRYLFWSLLVIICNLFVLYGWIKEIAWMILVFLGPSYIFVAIALSSESENIEIINNLWDDLDNLKRDVSYLKDTIFNLKLDTAKKQDETEKEKDYWKDKYPR